MTTTDTPLDTEELDADLAGELHHRWGVPYAVGNHIAAQLERYRNIIIILEAELAEATGKAMLAEHLYIEVAELRAQVAKLLELNAEGRPWQITKAAGA